MSIAPAREIPDCDYLLARAEAEARKADLAADPAVSEAHHKLASAYLDRIFGVGPAAGLSAAFLIERQREKRQALASALSQVAPAPDADPFSALLIRMDGEKQAM